LTVGNPLIPYLPAIVFSLSASMAPILNIPLKALAAFSYSGEKA
jgi:hypothetical protein